MSFNNSSAEFKALSGAINKGSSFTDFTIRFGTVHKEIHVHKVVISQNSSVFRKIFEESLHLKELLIDDVEHDVMLSVLKYLYDGRIEPVPDSFSPTQILDCAAFLGIDPLVRLTFNEIMEKLAACNLVIKDFIMNRLLIIIHQKIRSKMLTAEFFIEIIAKAKLSDSVLELLTKKLPDEATYPDLARTIMLGLLNKVRE